MTPFQIRLAQLNDAAEIATVHVKTWQYAYRGQLPDEFLDNMSVEERTKRWREILAGMEMQERVLVAEVDGKIVGFCVVGRSRDQDAGERVGELYSIHVDAQSMNHGVGTALMRMGQSYLAEQGYARATLWVLETNARARRFYERKGWRQDGTRREDVIANATVPQVRYVIHFRSGES